MEKTKLHPKHRHKLAHRAQGKKTKEPPLPPKKSFKESNLERALYRWYERRSGPEAEEGAPPGPQDVLRKARALAKRFGADDSELEAVTEDWVDGWKTRFGVVKPAEPPTPAPTPTPPPPLPPHPPPPPDEETRVKTEEAAPEPDIGTVLGEGGYTDDQVYTAVVFELDWTSLPDRSLRAGPPDERVWLLTAANRSGRHRTRILITGKRWRPPCLKHVNMFSQPVVYAGGGVGRITPDLFIWWFHKEFVPAALALNETGAVLVAEWADFLPPASECLAQDGKVRLLVRRPDTEPRLDLSLVRSELCSKYAVLLLHCAGNEAGRWVSVPAFLDSFTLKDAFPLLHRAWLNLRPETFSRAWDACPPSPLHLEEDRALLLELQWLAHDLGLEVTDDDVASWASSPVFLRKESAVKTEPREESDQESTPPTALEAAAHLAKALAWMESEPVDPSFLLVVRDVMTIAKQARLPPPLTPV
jgi:hypothetical protein